MLEDLNLPKSITVALEKESWTIDELAVTTVERLGLVSLTKTKRITPRQAVQIIGAAGRKINETRLQQSYDQVMAMLRPAGFPVEEPPPPFMPAKTACTAFPEEWLSGAAPPPPMSVRIVRIFRQAQAAYERDIRKRKFSVQRDHNAALNILARGLGEPPA